jgi:hypothetical protein
VVGSLVVVRQKYPSSVASKDPGRGRQLLLPRHCECLEGFASAIIMYYLCGRRGSLGISTRNKFLQKNTGSFFLKVTNTSPVVVRSGTTR